MIPADERQIVETWLDAFQRRKPFTALRLSTGELVVTLPAAGSAVGPREHHGRLAVARLLVRIMRLTRGSLRMQPQSVSEPDNGVVVARTRNTARRGPRRLDLEMTLIYRVQAGKITAIEERVDDLQAWQRFWN